MALPGLSVYGVLSNIVGIRTPDKVDYLAVFKHSEHEEINAHIPVHGLFVGGLSDLELSEQG